MDAFFGTGPVSVEAEYNTYNEHLTENGKGEIKGKGFYVQGGVLVTPQLEFALRYQEADVDETIFPDKLMWTSFGCNYYFRDHDFKVQAEYTLKKEANTSLNNDVFAVQLQLSF